MAEPAARWGHASALVEGKLCLWGGRSEYFLHEWPELAFTVHTFDPFLESWTESIKCTGNPPPGLYESAYTSAGHYLYVYGGKDGLEGAYNSLHRLDTKSWTWTQLSGAEEACMSDDCL